MVAHFTFNQNQNWTPQTTFPDGIELRSHIVHWVVCLTLLFWDERGRFSKILDVGYWGWRGGPLNRNGSHNISETNFATHEQNLFFATWIILYRLDWTMCIKHDYVQDTINRRAHTLLLWRFQHFFMHSCLCGMNSFDHIKVGPYVINQNFPTWTPSNRSMHGINSA